MLIVSLLLLLLVALLVVVEVFECFEQNYYYVAVMYVNPALLPLLLHTAITTVSSTAATSTIKTVFCHHLDCGLMMLLLPPPSSIMKRSLYRMLYCQSEIKEKTESE